MRPVSVILHDIRSSENVGSIFRTADGAGVEKIYLTGYTPAPLDRFRRKNAKLAKTALGAEGFVPWERTEITELMQALKKDNIRVIAVEQNLRAVPYRGLQKNGPTAFIFGNEVNGLPKDVLKATDAIIDIPMHGKKESLNVAVAAGIILYS
jgi:tRNA G18 (ribose-2'-O)-methylase SpoU